MWRSIPEISTNKYAREISKEKKKEKNASIMYDISGITSFSLRKMVGECLWIEEMG